MKSGVKACGPGCNDDKATESRKLFAGTTVNVAGSISTNDYDNYQSLLGNIVIKNSAVGDCTWTVFITAIRNCGWCEGILT